MSSEFGWFEIKRPARGVAVVVLHGEHDMSTVGRMTSEFETLEAEGASVVLDLSVAEFVDSSVLGAIHRLAARQEEAGRGVALQVRNGSVVHRALEIAGFLATLPNAEDQETAIELALGRGAGSTPDKSVK
jgi:anti-anti-sigma factor